jgi:NAD(P)H-dependent FMN reductase
MNMSALKIKVITGSTRADRFSEKPALWITDELKKQEGVEVELLDLRDYPMPFFEEGVSPSMKKEPYKHPVVSRWTAKIAEGDAFVIVTPEYNHGYPAVLKNALDYVYPEWNKKAVGFVSYGTVGGARAVEQLRQVAVELQMAPIRQSIHLPADKWVSVLTGKMSAEEMFVSLAGPAETFIDQLAWWARALKAARV